MTIFDGFRPVAEVTADDRARIAFGKIGVTENGRYAVSVNDDGAVLLVPVVSIPKRELPVWENAELRASLFRGLADAAERRVKRTNWTGINVDSTPASAVERPGLFPGPGAENR
jgi:hypothetical protein